MTPILEYLLRKRRQESKDYEMDGRRGRDRRSNDYDGEDWESDGRRGRRRDRARDFEDYDDYDDDYGEREKLRLRTKDYRDWKQNLENADGSEGPHFTLNKVIEAAEGIGIKFSKFTEKDLCMTANMLYSDLCTAFDIPQEKELEKYVKAAYKWLCDKDAAIKDSAKLATYYYTIVCGGEF